MNQLKDAEKTASLMVANERKAQTARMAEAKVEAEKIVSQFKDTQEGTYQQALNAVNSATGDEGNKLMASTNADIAEMQGDFVERKGDVEDMLVNLVTKVEYKPRPARTGTQ